jgi:hypothetical protein
MATTTNFGWTTPDDTDLVKDGAAAIRTLGSSIDTSLVDLNGGTTGQVLTKASDTDLDFSFTTPATNPITTEGDLVIGDASGDAVRLPIGALGTVLTSDGDTADWAAPAGGSITWALLNSGGTSLSGSKTTVSFSAQKQLLIFFEGASSNSASSFMSIRINDDSSAIYNTNGNKVIAQSSFIQDQQMSAIGIPGDTSIRGARMTNTASSIMYGGVSIFGADTAGPKVFIVNGGETIDGGTGGEALNTQGIYTGSLAVTSISFNTSAGTWDAGNVFIYGGN